MKRLLTGLQPSGQLHIGNYFGALKPFADTYQEYESFLMVADYHSLTSLKDPKALRENIYEIVRAYLAAGVDPEKAVIFKQSDVQEHTELAWIFECLVTVPFLMRGHAFKTHVDKAFVEYLKKNNIEADFSDEYFNSRSKEDPTYDGQVERIFSGINAGILNYPMLMAADILLYSADVVPVGKDQKQHVEYAREAANKFHNEYGETFTIPQEKISEDTPIIPGTDGRKMSKSYKNTIPLFAPKEEVAKAVMSIVTDSESAEQDSLLLPGNISRPIEEFPRPSNVYLIHRLFSKKSEQELKSFYVDNQGKYKNLKEALIADIEAVVGPMRAKYESITEQEIKDVLAKGAEKAKAVAFAKMTDVRQKVGVSL